MCVGGVGGGCIYNRIGNDGCLAYWWLQKSWIKPILVFFFKARVFPSVAHWIEQFKCMSSCVSWPLTPSHALGPQRTVLLIWDALGPIGETEKDMTNLQENRINRIRPVLACVSNLDFSGHSVNYSCFDSYINLDYLHFYLITLLTYISFSLYIKHFLILFERMRVLYL